MHYKKSYTLMVMMLSMFLTLLAACSQQADAPTAPKEEVQQAVEPAGETDALSAETEVVDLTFILHEDVPALTKGSDENAEWDREAAEPGAIIFHDGQFHMLRVGHNIMFFNPFGL